MPRFVFDGNEVGPPVSMDAEEGGSLLDICDEAGAAVVFSCRSASCGTCRVDVLEGAELLTPPKRDELEVLEIFASSSGGGDGDPSRAPRRLACQAVARPGAGLIHLRWVSD
jgi:ferredoxin